MSSLDKEMFCSSVQTAGSFLCGAFAFVPPAGNYVFSLNGYYSFCTLVFDDTQETTPE